jgi:hypothetical protein
MCVIDAPQAGTGKTLLGEIASIVATGERAQVSTPEKDDAEMRK